MCVIRVRAGAVPTELIGSIARCPCDRINVYLAGGYSRICDFKEGSLCGILGNKFMGRCGGNTFFGGFSSAIYEICRLRVSRGRCLGVGRRLSLVRRASSLCGCSFLNTFLETFRVPTCFGGGCIYSAFITSILRRTNMYDFRGRLYFIGPVSFRGVSNTGRIFLNRCGGFRTIW